MMVENMCRACLISEGNEFSFQNMEMPYMKHESTIGNIFSKISTIKHDPNDGLPQKICQKCFEELCASYEFQKKCLKSDLELKNLIQSYSDSTVTKKEEIKVEISEPEIEVVIDNWVAYSDDETSENIKDSLVEPLDDLEESIIERPTKRKNSYTCTICNKIFDRSFGLNRHIKSHKPGEILKFECQICTWKFTTEKNLTKHLEEKHSEGNEGCYPCPNCPRKFMKKASRSAHMQSHKNINDTKSISKKDNAVEDQNEKVKLESPFPNDVKPFHLAQKSEFVQNILNDNIIRNENNLPPVVNTENSNDDEESDEVELPNPKNKRKAVHECEVCQKSFDRKYRLQRHLNIHNPEGRPFECEVCKWRFASEQNLTRHKIMHTAVADCLKQNNEKPKVYKCSYCTRKFAKKESLASHMRVHKANMPASVALQKNFKCQFCPKAFYKITSLTRHLYTHDDEKDFQCNLCDKSFSLRGQLVDHMNWHKGIKPFRCEVCSKSFNQSSTLKDHLRTHSGEKPFLCSECGKGFNNSSNLRQHTLRHSGDKPFKCTECPSSFTSKGGLKSHMSTHTKLKPHVCDTCGSAFTKRYSLKKHKRIHTGEKPYECSTCHMRFTSSNHLKRHIRTHTGEKPYACKYCERAFAQSNDLVKHLKSHLGDKIYKCDRCQISFRLHTELRDHQYEHYRKEKQTQQEMQDETKHENEMEINSTINISESLTEKLELKTELQEPSVSVQYQCLDCVSLFSTPDDLKLHHINEHSEIKN